MTRLQAFRRVVRRIPSFLSRIFALIADLIYKPPTPVPPPELQRLIPWQEVRGDKTLRIDYDLTSDSLVIDVGGFEGQWASDIFSKYCCCIYIFEPVDEFADFIEQRFANNPRVVVKRFGLAGANKKERITLSGDASSFHTDGGTTKIAQLVPASGVLRDLGLDMIDLMKINIEGGEFELLDHLLTEGWISRIRHIQVQFHDFVPGATGKMQEIRERLAETHEPTYQYTFVWESWSLKS